VNTAKHKSSFSFQPDSPDHPQARYDTSRRAGLNYSHLKHLT